MLGNVCGGENGLLQFEPQITFFDGPEFELCDEPLFFITTTVFLGEAALDYTSILTKN